MLERCRQHRITLNLYKCIFSVLFGILLVYIICNEGMLVDLAKIAIIVNLPPPMNVKQIRKTLGHMGYYRKFITGYPPITTPMEKLFNKDAQFEWSNECQGSVDTLKKKMVTSLILVFLD